MVRVGQPLVHAIFLALLLVISPLSGCLSTPGSGPVTPSNPNTEPVDAYGLWKPSVDGFVSTTPQLNTGYTEWNDALQEDVVFKEADSSGALVQTISPITFYYKKVNFVPENTLAMAVEIDSGLMVNKGQPASVQITVDSRVFSNGVVATPSGGATPPTYTGGFDEKLESVYDLSGGGLVIESTVDNAFINSNEILLEIQIDFADGTVWRYSRISHFNYVIPINVPTNDLKVTNVEVVQAVQTETSDVRLVAEKDTLVRVFVDSVSMPTANTKVILELCDVVLGCYDHLVKYHLAVQNPVREDISHSANFILPHHWTVERGTLAFGGVTFKASVEPYYPSGTMDYAELDWSTNKKLKHVYFDYTTDLTVWSVRVGEQVVGVVDPLTGPVAVEYLPQSQADDIMSATEALFPVSDLTVVNFPDSVVPWCNYMFGADDCMAATEIWWRPMFMSGSSTLPNADQIHGMTPQVGFHAGFYDYGGLSAPAWAAGWFNSNSMIGWTPLIGSLHTVQGVCNIHTTTCAAHEMTHNLGPYCWDASSATGTVCDDHDDEAWGNHLSVTGWGATDACGADGQDQVWSANLGDFTIKDLGWNSMAQNPDSNQLAIVPANYPDYMSYCQAAVSQPAYLDLYEVPYLTENGFLQWTSTHRWEWMFDKFDNWQENNPANPYNGRQENVARMIVGSFDNDGENAVLENSWEFDGVVPPEFQMYGEEGEGSDFQIVLLDEEAGVVQQIWVDVPNETGHIHGDVDEYHNSSSKFVFTVQDSARETVRIELYKGDELIDSIDSVSSGGSPFEVVIENRNTPSRDVPFELGWNIEGGEDGGQYYSQIEYSWDGAFWMPIGNWMEFQTRSINLSDLPGGEEVQFRVRVSNGFDTVVANSNVFSLSNLAPEIILDVTGPSEFQMGSGTLFIEADIDDPEWEHIDYDNVVVWLEGSEGVVIDICGTSDGGSNQTDGRDGIDNNCWGIGDDDDCHFHDHSHGGDSHSHCHTHGGINIGTIGFGLAPGDYVLNVEYTDSGGNVAEAEYRFTVASPEYSNLDLEEFRGMLSPED